MRYCWQCGYCGSCQEKHTTPPTPKIGRTKTTDILLPCLCASAFFMYFAYFCGCTHRLGKTVAQTGWHKQGSRAVGLFSSALFFLEERELRGERRGKEDERREKSVGLGAEAVAKRPNLCALSRLYALCVSHVAFRVYLYLAKDHASLRGSCTHAQRPQWGA